MKTRGEMKRRLRLTSISCFFFRGLIPSIQRSSRLTFSFRVVALGALRFVFGKGGGL